MQKNQNWIFNATDLLYIFIKDWSNAFKLENVQKLKFEGEWA